MPNRYVQEWLAALRSGEFQQTRRVLKDGDGYCCLGVACHLSLKNDWPMDWEGRERVETYLTQGGVTLPESVRNLLGLRDSSGAFNDPEQIDGHDCLADRNDNGCTFEKIADLIESKPPGLFVDPYPEGARLDPQGNPISDIY